MQHDQTRTRADRDAGVNNRKGLQGGGKIEKALDLLEISILLLRFLPGRHRGGKNGNLKGKKTSNIRVEKGPLQEKNSTHDLATVECLFPAGKNKNGEKKN